MRAIDRFGLYAYREKFGWRPLALPEQVETGLANRLDELSAFWPVYRLFKQGSTLEKMGRMLVGARARFGRLTADALALAASGAIRTYEPGRWRAGVCSTCGAKTRFLFEGNQPLPGGEVELWTCHACGSTIVFE